VADRHIPLTGGCLCGAVRYMSKEPPTEGYYCHCTTCRKHYGSLFSATVRIPGSAFAFTKGQLKYCRSSNFGKRGFCADCGSPMAFIFEGNTDVWISVGSLDYPEDWPLTKDASWGQSTHSYIDSKVPWYEINDGLPQRTSKSAAQLEAAKAYVASTS
jgi:hypothetical protein